MNAFIWLILKCLIFGIGFGFFVQRGGLCFAHGLGEIYMNKPKRILRLFLVIFVISTIGFTLSGFIKPELGLKSIGELRGHGFFNLIAGFFFGIGIGINGGCILGSLRSIGEGNLLFLIVLISFIPGMALVVYGINPWLQSIYEAKKITLFDLLPGVPIWCFVSISVVVSLFLLWKIQPVQKNKK